MGTDFNILRKGLKQLGLLLLLFIASPILLSMSFKAIAIFKEGIQYWFSIAFLIVSSLLMLFTVFYAFKTFRTILSSLFHDK
ncbi:DUF6095 family protein [Pseudotenacibaculum sp. MALMAid0570]|uniref:DUF6095 family protein n=1 Tax=Pseudotenacibaculum sp. MALMAid0570 TaxID=3143938 RepID=UPI0032E03FE5